MKKIDKLLLNAFSGPFLMTFVVIVFILLSIHMLRYFDDIIGKGLELTVIAHLLFYFSVLMTPHALPLAVLVSSLITYGNLAEFGELSAIKSAGISLPRIMLPIFVVVVLLTVLALQLNNIFVPRAALEAYSLLYDIKKKKPALTLHEGVFYDGVPGMSIKANKTHSDGKTIEGIVLYDHRKDNGNREVIVADSGRMSTMLDDSFLKFELFRGYNYSEAIGADVSHEGSQNEVRPLARTRFIKSQMVFDLQSIQLTRTDKDLFQNYRMKNLDQLDSGSHLIQEKIDIYTEEVRRAVEASINLDDRRTKINANRAREQADSASVDPGSASHNGGTSKARQLKALLQRSNNDVAVLSENLILFKIQWHKIFTNSFACLTMFLIGAPLGSIIRKGGIGVPFLVSILFFIVFYVISLQGEKLAQGGLISAAGGAWGSNIILFLIGTILLRKAHNDTPLFESDGNSLSLKKIKTSLFRIFERK